MRPQEDTSTELLLSIFRSQYISSYYFVTKYALYIF